MTIRQLFVIFLFIACGVLVLVVLISALTHGSGVIFCDTDGSKPLANVSCVPCPASAVCQKGHAECGLGMKLAGAGCIPDPDITRRAKKISEKVKMHLERQNWLRKCRGSQGRVCLHGSDIFKQMVAKGTLSKEDRGTFHIAEGLDFFKKVRRNSACGFFSDGLRSKPFSFCWMRDGARGFFGFLWQHFFAVLLLSIVGVVVGSRMTMRARKSEHRYRVDYCINFIDQRTQEADGGGESGYYAVDDLAMELFRSSVPSAAERRAWNDALTEATRRGMITVTKVLAGGRERTVVKRRTAW